MKKRIITFILAAIMTLGVFVFASCKDNEGDGHEHALPSSTTSADGSEGQKDFTYFDIAEEVIKDHELSIYPLVKVSAGELLPDTDFPKIIRKDGENVIYSYRILSETCRTILTQENAASSEYVWLTVDVENNVLHGYFYDPLTEGNDPAYEYLSKKLPTSSTQTREIIFYRVPKK